ncbi:hypothetical protein DL98DRAFT_584138 [Cadophora sp. DSE1049]|nr:hypothetical protein DL98DRAFT_584138 [Cadophora sp. DSE1049]
MSPSSIAATEFENQPRDLALRVTRALNRFPGPRAAQVRPRGAPPLPSDPPRYRATQDYHAQNDSELTIYFNETLTVLQKYANAQFHRMYFEKRLLIHHRPTFSFAAFTRTSSSQNISSWSEISRDPGISVPSYQRACTEHHELPMPEHTLFDYVLRNGGINITADEWRLRKMAPRPARSRESLSAGPQDSLQSLVNPGEYRELLDSLVVQLLAPPPPTNRTMMKVFENCAAEVVANLGVSQVATVTTTSTYSDEPAIWSISRTSASMGVLDEIRDSH